MVWVDDPTPPGALIQPLARSVDFDDNMTEETDRVEVSSTGLFELHQGNHTIYWLAQAPGNSPTMTVEDSSMTFVCSKNLLGNSDPIFIEEG